jgi:hypothetical protein
MDRSLNKSTDSSPRAVLLCAIIFLSIFALAVALIIASNRFDAPALFKAVVNHIFISHYSNFNSFQPGTVDGKNIVTSFELLALSAILTCVFIFTFFINVMMPRWRLSATKVLTISWLMAFAVFSLLVQLKRAQALGDYQKQFAPLKLEERIESIMGMPYVFARNCSAKLKKPLNIEFVSGVPPTKDPYMTYQRGMSYYFYPKVSVRVPWKGERDGKLYFYKGNVLKEIPPDQRIACQSRDFNYVLTVRKDKFEEYVDH